MYLIVCLKGKQGVIGCEVWRALDGIVDAEKMMMDLSGHENLQMALLVVFDSQITGGKRYYLASMGRLGQMLPILTRMVWMKPSDSIMGWM
jgi:hypothetical protein